MDATATAIIGFRFKREDLFTKARVKAFEHACPEDWTHDPTSGRLLWREEERCALPVEYDQYENIEKICGLDFVQPADSGERQTYCYLEIASAHKSHHDDRGAIIDWSALAEEAIRAQQLLAEAGLLDKCQLGLWSVLEWD